MVGLSCGRRDPCVLQASLLRGPKAEGESRTGFEGDSGEKNDEESRQETFFQENAFFVSVTVVNVFKETPTSPFTFFSRRP